MRMRDESLVADGLLSVEEAMAFLSVGRTTVYELMDKGFLPYAKIGRSRRVPRRAVVELAAANLHGGSALLPIRTDEGGLAS